jgi:hypothetical protein
VNHSCQINRSLNGYKPIVIKNTYLIGSGFEKLIITNRTMIEARKDPKRQAVRKNASLDIIEETIQNCIYIFFSLKYHILVKICASFCVCVVFHRSRVDKSQRYSESVPKIKNENLTQSQEVKAKNHLTQKGMKIER